MNVQPFGPNTIALNFQKPNAVYVDVKVARLKRMESVSLLRNVSVLKPLFKHDFEKNFRIFSIGMHPCEGPNEEYGPIKSCPPNTCDAIGKLFKCAAPPDEMPMGCVCKIGFRRNVLNKCVSEEECKFDKFAYLNILQLIFFCLLGQKCTEPFTYWGDNFRCPGNTCAGYFAAPYIRCAAELNPPKDCICIIDYYRNSKGECVHKGQCKVKNSFLQISF